MSIGPLTQSGHRQHDDGVRQTQSAGPRQGGPLCLVGYSAHKVGRKDSRDDHSGVAGIGEVVHGPAKDFSALDTWIQHDSDSGADVLIIADLVQMTRSASATVATRGASVVAFGRFAQLERADQVVKSF